MSTHAQRVTGKAHIAWPVETPAQLEDVGFDPNGEFTYGETAEDIAADNLRRAGFAAAAVQVFAKRVGLSDDELFTAFGDLLCDLRHLADAVGIEFEDALERSLLHYEPEIHGEF